MVDTPDLGSGAARCVGSSPILGNPFHESLMKIMCLLPAMLFGALFADNQPLIDCALKAQKQSYAPYSKYYVGAAVLTKSGKMYGGCNVENASYGLTNCAERTALFKAISEGEREIEAVVVVTRNGGFPCGACRQVLNEFNPRMQVICVDEQGTITSDMTLDKLLPKAFGPANLD